MSDLFKLNSSDFLKSLIVAVLAAVLTALANAFNTPGFDFVTYDWSTLVTVALTAGASYLSKNLLTTADGKFGGIL